MCVLSLWLSGICELVGLIWSHCLVFWNECVVLSEQQFEQGDQILSVKEEESWEVSFVENWIFWHAVFGKYCRAAQKHHYNFGLISNESGLCAKFLNNLI